MTFTDKKPTVPGAYACRTGSTVSLVFVYKSGDRLVSGGFPVEDLDRLWSSRLVPVEEVERWVGICEELVDELSRSTPEKNCSCCISPPCRDCVDHGSARELLDTVHRMFSARRVVEGGEL